MTKRSKRTKRNKVPLLIRNQKFRCAYCGSKIFRVSTLQKYREIIKKNEFEISWSSSLGIHTVRIATLEHKTPLSLGGNNSIKNLCMVCRSCNHKEARMTDRILNERKHKKRNVVTLDGRSV